MANATMIPALPCASINETLDFYTALGFRVTYQQTRPNTYACVKYEDIDLHFFSMKSYVPAESYSTCLVLIDDADALYATFAANLRQHYGKLPITGIPRIGKPSNHNASGDWRFNVVDPGGNWIRFIQRGQPPEPLEAAPTARLTPLGRALQSASFLMTGKGDYAAAAQVLDKALAQDTNGATNVEQIRALVLRAEIGTHLLDNRLARKLLADVRAIPLRDDERQQLDDDLQRAEEIAQQLSPS
jgi:catechol 2,3-dioxygenase-like lactoylglutathione lyase family enzyme